MIKKNHQPLKYIFPVLVLLAGLALIAICFFLFSSPKSDPDSLKEGLAYLENLENQDAAQINSQILAQNQTTGETIVLFPSAESPSSTESPSDNSGDEPFTSASADPLETQSTADDPEISTEATATESPSEETDWLQPWKDQITGNAIVNLTEEERASYRARLTNCAIVGDSMAQAALEYGFLDSSHVFYLRGAAVGQLGDTIAAAAGMLPSTVIFFTGLNDTDYYAEPADYAAAYLEKIQELKALLPDVSVYVCSMLPPSNDLGAVRPDLARAPLYDEALRHMCNEQGIGYIDTYWMVSQSLYMADGIHFISSFYDIWIQYICACTGL
jgi:hypothetical protein